MALVRARRVGEISPRTLAPVRVALTNRDAAADGAVEHLRGLLDPGGGGVQRIGDRALRCLGAIRRARARITQRGEFLFETADAMGGVEQFVAHRQRRHHRQPRIADFAELAAQILNPRLKTLGELQEPYLLPLLAGHPVLPPVDGAVDVVHEVSPASSTERMVPIAASSRSAISRLARSSRRDFTSDPSSSSASRDRSAPSAWIRIANSFSSRSASCRRSTALSNASSAAIRRRVAASTSGEAGPALPEPLVGRSLMAYSGPSVSQPRSQNPRFGKRLDREIYVASEPSATALQSYAPLSNFSPLQRVSPPWTPGIQMLSSPDFPLPQACARGIRFSGGRPPSTSFQADFIMTRVDHSR